MASKTPKKHVIFIGAGASWTSGYPTGDALRLRLSSRERFKADMRAGLRQPVLSDADGVTFDSLMNGHVSRYGPSMDMFRTGGFGTVDEFSKLCSSSRPDQAEDMKKLTRLAFSFHNPEDSFHESDYYPFIQRLFSEDDLSSLKKHITILSYNYDCYLDFLLINAIQQRHLLAYKTTAPDAWYNPLTSGLYNLGDTSWADQTDGFGYFKLHGSIAYAQKHDNPWQALFIGSPMNRVIKIAGNAFQLSKPPMVFPWELFDEAGSLSDKYFSLINERFDGHTPDIGKVLFQLFTKIWAGARNAVQRAEKISFVGMSMHPYLNDGLRFLFKDKSEPVEVVVANIENEKYKDWENPIHPFTLCGKVIDVLKAVAPKLKCKKSSYDHYPATRGLSNDQVTPRFSFKEFIQTEMD